jgi:hypothetical protein
MLFPPRILAGIKEGRVDRAFRRWERPRVRPGGRQRTAIGVIGFEAVEVATPEELGEEDARRSGHGSLAELLAFLGRRSAGDVYRIRLRLVGEDPRVALRSRVPDAKEMERITRRLERLDRASRNGAWTRATLAAIRGAPAVRAGDLAAGLGRERMPFKLDVRKLKELGLTESLPVGYRLSPRGEAVLRLMERPAEPEGTRTRPSRPRRPAGR